MLGMTPSMSRKGNCYDNVVAESFFSTLKNELLHHQTYHTRDEASREIFAFIEGFYSRHRLHPTGYVSWCPRNPWQLKLTDFFIRTI